MHDADSLALLWSLLVLALGPLLYQLVRLVGSMLATLDGFVFVALGGLIVLHVIPESIVLGGWVALGAGLVGWLAPSLIEHRLHFLASQAHAAALVLGLTGIVLHALMDGMALVGNGEGVHTTLPMAVILHRLPVGLTLWFLLRPLYGLRVALGVLGVVALATLVGFATGEVALSAVGGRGRGLFQALVAGALLHVLVHRSSAGAGCLWGGLGALGGGVLVWSIARSPGLGPAVRAVGEIVPLREQTLWAGLKGLCLALLAGLFLASLLRPGRRGLAGEVFSGEEGDLHPGRRDQHPA